MKRRLMGLALSGLALATGCAGLDDYRGTLRDRALARGAWDRYQMQCGGSEFPADFGRGFQAGFTDVATGGLGCPPELPPKRYWSAAYQNPCGQQRVSAWFAGFREGAAVAKGSNLGSYAQIVTASSFLRDNPVRNVQPGGLPPTFDPAYGPVYGDPSIEPVPVTGIPDLGLPAPAPLPGTAPATPSAPGGAVAPPVTPLD